MINNSLTVLDKQRIRVRKTADALGKAFSIVCTLLILWVVVSWFDVTAHNLTTPAIENMLNWNFFIVLFNDNSIDYSMLFNITLVINLVIQSLMKNNRVKKMCSLMLLAILTVLGLIIQTWLAWILMVGLVLAVIREILYIKGTE